MIHPLSDVKSENIGEGTNIWQFCVVLEGAKIGKNCNICSNCFIENDVVIGNNVTVKNGVSLYDEKAHVWHIFPIRCEERDSLQKHLEENGIQTLIHYPTPPYKQGAYKEWGNQSYPISEEIHRRNCLCRIHQ